MARDLVIIGAGGFGREVAQLVRDLNAARPGSWNLLGFVDDDPSKRGTEVGGLPVVGDLDWLLASMSAPAVAMGLGAPCLKARINARLAAADLESPVLVHPSAWIGERVTLGAGTLVTAGCILTTDISVGRFVTLNLGCTVGHDAEIADHATLAPGVNVSGAARVAEGADLGTGSSTIQGVHVGRWSTLGAGAVVARDIPPNVVAVGVPARPIRTRDEGWHLG
jgi:sugar O-acyltransferase (sialic acid O-acetyltransferase NeuD family)